MTGRVVSPPDIPGLTFVESLGSGGYADVFRYERQSPRMSVAVKILRDGEIAASELAQFAAEAETMAALSDHPNIVQVFSTGALEDGRPYLVMKFYPPPNLAVRAKQERLAVSDVLRTGIKLASAVETAHRAGILHRDIKPANVLISAYGEPGLTDFGIAGHLADDDGDDLGVSIPWCAPEILTGASNGSVRSDLYSLAATLWHLLAGRAPFEVPGSVEANKPTPLMTRTIQSAVPSTGRADVPASLERVLARAMAKRPEQRFTTSLELARQLQGVEQEQRWARTELVIEGFGGARRTEPDTARRTGSTQTQVRPSAGSEQPARPRSGGESTVVRPARVAPRPPAPSFADPITAAPRSESVARGGDRPQSAPESTLRRPSVSTGAPSESAAASDSARSAPLIRRSWIAAIGVAAVVLAVVIGVVLSSGGSKAPSNSPTSSQPSLALAAPPGNPVIDAHYDRGRHQVVFTWTYSNPKPGDFFEVTRSLTSPRPQQVTVRHFEVAAQEPGAICLYVSAHRADGTAGSEFSRHCYG